MRRLGRVNIRKEAPGQFAVVTPLYYILRHIYSGPTIVVSLLATVQMVMNQRRFVTFGLCIRLRLRGNPNSLDFTQI